MIDNFKKRINSNVGNIGKSVYKELNKLSLAQKDADALLSTIKSKHSNSNISNDQIVIYRTQLNKIIGVYNRIFNVAVNTRNKLQSIDKIVTAFNRITTTLSNLITTLQVIPAPAQFTPIGVIMILSSRLNSASTIVSEIKKFLSTVTIVLQNLIDKFNIVLTQLETLNNTIQEIIALLISKSTTFVNDLDINQDSTLQQFTNNISNIIGTYKEYTFVLRVDDDPTYNVGDIKRKYAVATLEGRDIYFSDKSYTLNPEILIDQLKLQIDK